MKFTPCEKVQATAPPTVFLPADWRMDHGETSVRWLSAAGVLINCHGTNILIDPLLSVISDDPAIGETSEMLLTAPAILADEVGKVDGVLYTHADNDHLGPVTAAVLIQGGSPFHAPAGIILELKTMGLRDGQGFAHKPGDTFRIGCMEITVTPAFHPHQLSSPDFTDYYGPEDCCGFRISTPEGIIWVPGDSLLMNEHLEQKDIDLMFIDFSDNVWHFGLDCAIGLANVHETAELIAYHFGTFNGPDHNWCNADPEQARLRLRSPERLHVQAPGQKYIMGRKSQQDAAASQ